MIGRVEFVVAGEKVSAELLETGSWRSDDADYQRFLNARFPLSGYGPSAGARGAACLHDAAKALRGEVVEKNYIIRDELNFEDEEGSI